MESDNLLTPIAETAEINIEIEREMAGLQSMINGWIIEIQILQEKIKEVQEMLLKIKTSYRQNEL